MQRLLIMATAALTFLTLTVGCSPDTEVATGKNAGNEPVKAVTLCENWKFEHFYTVLTPENSNNLGPFFYLVNFYETLVNYEDGQIVPGLAESWSISADGLVYTFKLKRGVKFSDGSDFNADVVKKNLEMIPVISGEYDGALAPVTPLFKEIKVIDPYTVEMHLTSPYYGALQDFTKLNPLGMMSAHAFNEDGTLSERLLTSTMGTGPYMCAGPSNDGSFTFIKNPHYHGKEPEVDQFHVKVIPDNQAKALALRSGEIDLILGSSKISYDSYKEIAANKKYGAKASGPNGRTRFIAFNVAKAPFDDRQVRLAVSHALDKESICNNLFYGIENKADTLFNRTLPYCDVAVEPYQHDPERAKKILEEAGWHDTDGDGIREKDGQKLAGEILYASNLGPDTDLVLTISSALKKLGFDMQENGLDIMAWYAQTQQGNFSITYATTYEIPVVPFTSISNMNSELQVDNIMVQGPAHLADGDHIIMELNTMIDRQEIQNTYAYLLHEIHRHIAFVPISYMKELVVFDAEKIADYRFNGQPSSLDVAGIKLK
ncbi:MAG: ABC transporter substrate-binding protein [Firmicutes bacterium]|nr:ABC transporter substrate-binding protein [Bacillota bacterium]